MIPDASHKKGLIITGAGGLLLTIDIPFIRLADMEPWGLMLFRSALMAVAITVYWAVKRLTGRPTPPLVDGWHGWAVGGIYGVANICFTLAVFSTSTANLVFILAFNATVAAILSWLFLHERPALATWLTIAATLVGVLIIVSGGIRAGHGWGDGLAFMVAFCMASALTLTRRSGKNLSMTPAIGGYLSALVALPVVWKMGFAMNANGLIYLLINGLLIIPIAAGLLALGPSYISAPKVAMFFLLETVLTPIWVWLIFQETPAPKSLIGGAIVITAIVAHSLWQLRVVREPARPYSSTG